MTWLILDLARQVREVLRPNHGGNGNANGWARGWLFDGFNATGSTIDLNTLVKYTGIANFVTPTTAANETGVLGVVVGYLDGAGSLVEDDCPTGGPVAVLMAGVAPVIVDSTVDRGEYAFASGTAGQAASNATSGVGVFGQFLEAATADFPALVRLLGTGGASAAAGLGHDDLTGVTTDQHHAEDHDITGAEHTSFPGGTSTFLRGDGAFATPGSGSGGAGGYGWYGDASDGDATLDGSATPAWTTRVGSVYTITRDAYLHNLTVNSGVTLTNSAGMFRIYCTGTLTNAGTIHSNGGDASGATGGSGPNGGNTTLHGAASQGVTGRVNSAGNGNNSTQLVTAGGGGQGGAGGTANARTAGTAGACSVEAKSSGWRSLPFAAMGWVSGSPSATATQRILGGTGGGGGASDSSTTTSSGGSGGGGGVVVIAAATINNQASGVISVRGGNGGNASSSSGGVAAGGGGGGGGFMALIYDALTNSGSISVAGGTKGTGVNGAGAANDGNAGNLIQLPMA